MDGEIQSMTENDVWIEEDLPPNAKVVGSKWLFKKKTDMDGNVHTYKARLVAKGYLQKAGIDYHETYAAVMRQKSLRIILVLATIKNYQ